jgi:hypothetical protein
LNECRTLLNNKTTLPTTTTTMSKNKRENESKQQNEGIIKRKYNGNFSKDAKT